MIINYRQPLYYIHTPDVIPAFSTPITTIVKMKIDGATNTIRVLQLDLIFLII